MAGGHLLSKINGKVNIWTITSFSSLHKWVREEISLYSQILTVMQLLTKIYIKRIKLIHDYLCCYPKPDWLEFKIIFFINGWRRERRNHVTITNGRSLPPNTDILNDVIQQDGRLHSAYNNYEVWPNVLLFYDIKTKLTFSLTLTSQAVVRTKNDSLSR